MSVTLGEATERLRRAGIESARADARILLEHAKALDLSIESLLLRRMAHEPVAYITRHKEFWSLDLEVGPGVLVPRPETETVVEEALRQLPDRERAHRILDLGTGSGCLLIALLSEFPQASGCGIEASDGALNWARRNISRHGLDNRAKLAHGGWDFARGRFDLIVANPPYVASDDLPALPPDVRDFEPTASLDGGHDGLDAFRSIASLLPGYLAPEGIALLEIGAGQHHMVKRIMEAEGLEVPKTAQDLAGIPRCVAVKPGPSASCHEKRVGNSVPTR